MAYTFLKMEKKKEVQVFHTQRKKQKVKELDRERP